MNGWTLPIAFTIPLFLANTVRN